MKTPESPRAYPPKPAESAAHEEREEKILPRYVQVPALREHGFGPRNLFWGVVALFAALLLLVVALFLAGSQAMLSLATCLLTFTALFVLARLHIFRQRNGGFLALALVCLLGAAIPLLENAFFATRTFLAQHRASAAAFLAAAPSKESDLPLLTQSFALTRPEGPRKQVKVLKDSRVLVGEKPFLIKAGDLFPFVETSAGQATFAVRDLQLSLPSEVVEVIDPQAVAKGVSGGPPAQPQPVVATNAAKSVPASPSADELAEITKSAQQEALRRYPALAIKDSLENAVFVSTYKQLQDAGSTDFFGNPEWPIELAELLAKREGWVRGSGPMTTGPAPVLEPPGEAPPPSDNFRGAR